MLLEFYLAAAQLCLIGLDFVKTAANFRRLLRRHPPVLVKFDWLVRHKSPALSRLAPFLVLDPAHRTKLKMPTNPLLRPTSDVLLRRHLSAT
jgi:hypothetical protein